MKKREAANRQRERRRVAEHAQHNTGLLKGLVAPVEWVSMKYTLTRAGGRGQVEITQPRSNAPKNPSCGYDGREAAHTLGARELKEKRWNKI